MLYFAEENRVMRKIESTSKDLTLSEIGEYFREDSLIFLSFLSPFIV